MKEVFFPIKWEDGQLLTARHLQAQERFYETMLSLVARMALQERFGLARPYEYEFWVASKDGIPVKSDTFAKDAVLQIRLNGLLYGISGNGSLFVVPDDSLVEPLLLEKCQNEMMIFVGITHFPEKKNWQCEGDDFTYTASTYALRVVLTKETGKFCQTGLLLAKLHQKKGLWHPDKNYMPPVLSQSDGKRETPPISETERQDLLLVKSSWQLLTGVKLLKVYGHNYLFQIAKPLDPGQYLLLFPVAKMEDRLVLFTSELPLTNVWEDFMKGYHANPDPQNAKLFSAAPDLDKSYIYYHFKIEKQMNEYCVAINSPVEISKAEMEGMRIARHV